jgi:hypothetical protein
MPTTTWRLPDPVFAPLRPPARPLSTRFLRTLTGRCLLGRALVVLIGAKTTLLQIPDIPAITVEGSSSANSQTTAHYVELMAYVLL